MHQRCFGQATEFQACAGHVHFPFVARAEPRSGMRTCLQGLHPAPADAPQSQRHAIGGERAIGGIEIAVDEARTAPRPERGRGHVGMRAQQIERGSRCEKLQLDLARRGGRTARGSLLDALVSNHHSASSGLTTPLPPRFSTCV